MGCPGNGVVLAGWVDIDGMVETLAGLAGCP